MSDPSGDNAPIPTMNVKMDVPDIGHLFQAMAVLDSKLDWCMQTLGWMAQVFQGLQAMTSVMPGKAGKMARDMMAQMTQQQNGDQTNG